MTYREPPTEPDYVRQGMEVKAEYPPAERLVESLRWALGYIGRLKKFASDDPSGPSHADWMEWAAAHDWLKDAALASHPTPDGPPSSSSKAAPALLDDLEAITQDHYHGDEPIEALRSLILGRIAEARSTPDGPASPVLGDEERERLKEIAAQARRDHDQTGALMVEYKRRAEAAEAKLAAGWLLSKNDVYLVLGPTTRGDVTRRDELRSALKDWAEEVDGKEAPGSVGEDTEKLANLEYAVQVVLAERRRAGTGASSLYLPDNPIVRERLNNLAKLAQGEERDG
jgi:hypothetical protein